MGTRCQIVDTHLHIRRAHIKSQAESNSENEKGLVASMQRVTGRKTHERPSLPSNIQRNDPSIARDVCICKKEKREDLFYKRMQCNTIRYDTTRHVAVVTYDLLPYPYHSLARSYTRIPMRRVPAHPAHTQTQVTWLRSRRVEGD